jgi:hypothetical protein
MGVKDVNVLEQHVEKIVLAVAAAGAIFLGYLAIQPVKIPDTEIGPGDVEDQIAGEIQKLDAATEKIKPFPMPNMDYLGQYRQLATQAPLDASLIASSNVPLFGPKNMAPAYQAITGPENYHLATPTPVAPENVTVEAWQQLVGILPPNTVGVGVIAPPPLTALPQPVNLPTRDQNAALIQGYIPVGKMQLEMAKVLNLNERLPANLQKASIYRIRAQRRENTAGGWSDWKEVPATKGYVSPTNIEWNSVGDVEPTMVQADAEFKQIVIPDFYVDDKGYPISAPILTKPLPKNIETESTKLADELKGAGGAAAVMPGAGGGMPYALPYAAPTGGGTPYVLPYAGGGVPAGTQPAGVAGAPPIPVPTPDQVKVMPVMPFAFWDETVLPGVTYQYRVEVDFINPTFHWNNGLKDAKMKNQPILTTGWFLIATPVVIHPDIAFFITGAGSMNGGGDTVSARVFKKNNGKWYRGEFITPTGMNISGMIDLVDKEGVPKIEVDTKYTIVDVQQVNSGVHVVLKDPAGNLVTRNSAMDMKNSENLDLYSHAEKRAVASAPSPTETGGTTVTPAVTPAPTYSLPYAPVTSRPGPVRVNPTTRPARGGG